MDTLQAWNSILTHTTPNGRLIRRGSPQRAVAELAADTMVKQRIIAPTRPPVGILSGDHLLALRQFAETAVSLKAMPADGHKRAVPSAEEHQYLAAMPVTKWCAEVDSRIGAVGNSVYIYYDTQGEVSRLHVDNSNSYDFNLLICLSRSIPAGATGSVTYFMLGDGVTKALSLMPGDAVLFHSSCTPHGRTPVVEGERVLLASLGFAMK